MKVGILGTGAYGLALSSILRNNNCDIIMWTKFKEEKELLIKERQNKKLLPNYKLDDKIKVTNNIDKCIKRSDLLIIAIPAAYINDVALLMKPYIKNNHILIATKGIEQETGLFIDEILKKHLNTKNIAVISGPSFAADIVNKMPIGLSLASKSKKTIRLAKKAFENDYLKMRDTTDVIGVEICGSIKNVIAIAAGMLAGLEENSSTTAMFLTEAIHDMMEILDAFGANKKTVTSFAGLGDLLLTCSSVKSRNFAFGKMIGAKKSKEEIDKYLKNTTVEGYYTLESIYKLLKNKKVNIPIINLIYDIVVNGKDPKKLLSFIVNKK